MLAKGKPMFHMKHRWLCCKHNGWENTEVGQI